MYHFEYVPESQTKPVKKELLEIIYTVQDLLCDKFTFRFDFIGSSARNMITQDVRSNIGFDFDVNIEVNDPDEDYSAEELRHLIQNALNRVAPPIWLLLCGGFHPSSYHQEKEHFSFPH